MLHNDTYDQLLQAFGASIGMTDLAFDTNGQCNLYVNDTIPLALRRNDDSQTLTVLCSLEEDLPSAIDQHWVRGVLEIALNPARNAPGVGFAPASDSLIIYRTLPLAALEGDVLQRVIAELVDMQERWPQMVSSPVRATGPLVLTAYA